MPLQLPNLDDRRYSDLVREGLALIPTYAPEWTNHNPSDPGITLVELFAYLTELLLYRLDRIADGQRLAFLKLLNGPEWKPGADKSLDEEIRDTVRTMRSPDRAVTPSDVERLAVEAGGMEQLVARARCVPGRDLESGDGLGGGIEKPGHMSVIIFPDQPSASQPGPDENAPQPSADLIRAVSDYLEPRRLLTTQVHVTGPRYVPVRVRLTVHSKPGAIERKGRGNTDRSLRADSRVKPRSAPANPARVTLYEDMVRQRIVNVLEQYLHPLAGGADGQGWPFGRSVYVSEIYALLQAVPGVDYVTETLGSDGQPLDELIPGAGYTERREPKPPERLASLRLEPHELVQAIIRYGDITVVTPPKSVGFPERG